MIFNARRNVRTSMMNETIKDIRCLRQQKSNIWAPMDECLLADNKSQPLIPMAPYPINADIHSDNEYKGYKIHTNQRERGTQFSTQKLLSIWIFCDILQLNSILTHHTGVPIFLDLISYCRFVSRRSQQLRPSVLIRREEHHQKL